MIGLGTLLQKARLKQGSTIEEMSARTNIRPQYLQAIEDEDFHVLPGEAYIKPFVRTYAKALGLEDQIASDLGRSQSAPGEVTVDSSIRERRERKKKARRRRFVTRSLGALIIIVGAVYLIYRLLNT